MRVQKIFMGLIGVLGWMWKVWGFWGGGEGCLVGYGVFLWSGDVFEMGSFEDILEYWNGKIYIGI